MGRARWLILGVVAALAACDFRVRAPINDINAGFVIADAAWFEAEQTLFVFYQVDAQQGLGPESQLEISWRTDTEEQPFVPLQSLPTVHTHLAVDCGTTSKCGSSSLRVPFQPRDVKLRLRYHRDGAVILDAPVTYNPIAAGPAHTNRSLIVYGVFDETNTRLQWRARHQFPTIRNEQAQGLGLRRNFKVADPRFGDLTRPTDGNPYAYGFEPSCPATLDALGWPPIETTDRAIFDAQALPVYAYSSPIVCGTSTVTDAVGTFDAAAIARKNPQTEPAFPLLRSPIAQNTPIGFMLSICDRAISAPHRAMQVQRLLLESEPEICLDGWNDPGFADQLASQFKSRIDQVRAQGNDMVLLFSVHHDDASGQLASVIEAALMKFMPSERDKSSPRVSGVFVFDTFSHSISTPELRRLVLWCPANALGDDLTAIPAASERTCPIQPDFPDLVVGPLKFNQLPILPTRAQYLKFIEKYSDAQAGRTKSLTFRAPTLTPLSENVPVQEFGVATFFNNEVLTAAQTDRFSFCASEELGANSMVFRVAGFPDVIPLSLLPEVQEQFPQPAYGLGLVWDFPFLLRAEYSTVVAGAVTAASFSVPFGISTTNEAYYGTQLWEKGEFPLNEVLLRCTRFCGHPTFDSAGVYNVLSLWTPTYRAQCYRPKYPVPGDGGFPIDP